MARPGDRAGVFVSGYCQTRPDVRTQGQVTYDLGRQRLSQRSHGDGGRDEEG
jgi:hypothetical protein